MNRRPRTPRARRLLSVAMAGVVGVSSAAGLGACTGPTAKMTPLSSPSSVQASDGALVPNAGITHPNRLAATKPNILFVTVDDMAPRDLKWMPKVRRLIGKQGMTFTNAIAPTPICAPSRASWMSGQYAQNHGVHTIEGPKGGFANFDEANRLPSWLQGAGYQTGFIGKYLNGNGEKHPRYVPPGWTDWRGSVDMTTYDFSRALLNVNGKLWHRVGYQTPTFARQTNGMIKRFSRSDKPWFININYVAPHHGGPVEIDDPPYDYRTAGRYKVQTPGVAERYRDKFKNLKIPRTPDQWRIPKNVENRPSFSSRDRRFVTEAWQQRLESLQSVDDAVAGHLRTLRRLGQLDDTLVVFMSDNGMSLGEHMRVGKLASYYESLQVPMVVRGPGIPRGTRSRDLVTNADLPVTFAALAGVRPTRSVDGIDIAPIFTGSRIQNRQVPLAAWQVTNGNRRKWIGLRVDRRWVYSRGNGVEALYDLTTDPYQTTNIAGRPDMAQRLARVKKLAKRLQRCSGENCQNVVWASDKAVRHDGT